MLELKNLTKFYGKVKALNGLNLTLEKGELFGFVGPNGAGKTTTMKIISGILMPSYGQILFEGEDIIKHPQKIKDKIGYMPDFFGVYDNLTVKEYMEFYSDIYKIDKKSALKRNYELLEMVGLTQRIDELVDNLSRGMKQRLCLARTMVHNPEILILDEPASGMEPRSRLVLKDILKNITKEGKIVFISSHVLSELSEMCTSIGIIEKGSMLMQGSIKELKEKQRAMQPLLIRFTSGMEHGMKVLKNHPKVSKIASYGEVISISFHGDDIEESELLATIISTGARVLSYKREESNLESLFLELTK